MPPASVCPACGTAAGGNFCNGCGASLAERRCSHCGASVVGGARYCHRCGRPLGATRPRRSERLPWLIAAAIVLLLVGAIVARVQRGTPGAGRAGYGQSRCRRGAGRGPVGPAPDISQMSPRERFDRLFNRVVAAAERADTTEVFRFAPMALGAYEQLDANDADARYHAAVLMVETGQLRRGAALADTILARAARTISSAFLSAPTWPTAAAIPPRGRQARDGVRPAL